MSEAVHADVEIAASAEHVWDVVMNPSRFHEWVTVHDGFAEPMPDALEEGTEFTQRLRIMGAAVDVRWKVIHDERPRRVEWEGAGPGGSRAAVRYALESLGDERIRFDYENDFKPPGGRIGRRIGHALGSRKARREAEQTLANLKELVEAQSVARPASRS